MLVASGLAGCGVMTGKHDCGAGSGARTAEEAASVLVAAAKSDAVDAACELFAQPTPRGEVAAILDQLRAQVDAHGGFDSLSTTLLPEEQLGSGEVVLLFGESEPEIGRIQLVSTNAPSILASTSDRFYFFSGLLGFDE
ncbi:MAG TPA: hypothetical protein PKE40_01665 [Arachnia sp.]|nr:hypothetical protein [Arachnia sp.]HMT85036.1 hypothetical protein [Arachnia sp.]